MSNLVHWGLLARMINFSFSQLDDYIPTVRSALKREKAHFESWLSTQLAGLDEDAADEQSELYAPDLQQLSDTFPELARRSAYLLIFSTFEHSLLQLCWRVQKITEESFGPQDLRGEFAGAQPFLQRMGRFKLSACGNWERITTYRTIRNVIVQQAGNVRLGDQTLIDLIRQTNGVSLDDEGMVCITDAFCVDAIATMRDFLQELIGRLRNQFA